MISLKNKNKIIYEYQTRTLDSVINIYIVLFYNRRSTSKLCSDDKAFKAMNKKRSINRSIVLCYA